MSTTPSTIDTPVRAAVFATREAAHKAVDALLAANFTQREITVVSSNATEERAFRAFEHQKPAGANTPVAAALGGAIGATQCRFPRADLFAGANS
jgi:phosphopantetheinyl transferase (holo-ACP synthase)